MPNSRKSKVERQVPTRRAKQIDSIPSLTPQVALEKKASKAKALAAQRFFKTGKGEYSEGDHFIGVTVPEIRKIAREYKILSLTQISRLLKSHIHEERFLALRILSLQFEDLPKAIFDFYVKHMRHVNNWDLVDTSAAEIYGAYLFENPSERKKMGVLAKSSNLWFRRIAMVSTFHFILNNNADETVEIAKILIDDKNVLIQKAVGWMLREVGKRVDRKILDQFLKQYATKMHRTALRYAIEHYTPEERRNFLNRAKNGK